jgi:hypothetical protein
VTIANLFAMQVAAVFLCAFTAFITLIAGLDFGGTSQCLHSTCADILTDDNNSHNMFFKTLMTCSSKLNVSTGANDGRIAYYKSAQITILRVWAGIFEATKAHHSKSRCSYLLPQLLGSLQSH